MDPELTPGGQPNAAPAQPADPAGQATTTETPAAPKGPSLAETIRQAREEREGRTRATAEATDLKTRLAAAEAALEAAKRQDDPVADPIAWARARKLDATQQAAMGQALLYDLVPEKAPADFRVRLLEAKIARDAQTRDERAAADHQAQLAAQAQAQLDSYRSAVFTAAQSFEAGSHPESEAWFGDDRANYARSLLATANNLATSASKTGQQANLNPANIAAVLEAEIAGRMKARDSRRGQRAQDGSAAPGPAPDGGGVRPTGTTTSTKGLSTGGPRNQAETDKERIARAVAAGFPKYKSS